MNTTESLRTRLERDDVLLGLSNSYPAAGIIEGMCPGWDLVWIDAQHGQFGYDSTINAVRAAELIGVAPLVRVPAHEPGLLGQWADMAPAAIMVPMVNDREQAEAVVRALRFPPLGQRSFGGRRPVDMHGRNYPTDHDLLIVAQIETPQAVENAEAIAAVEGIDMLFTGPDDMKLRLDIPLDTSPMEHPQLRQAVMHVAQVARSAGKFAGIPGVPLTAVGACVEMGYQLLIGGGDVGFMRTGSAATLAEFQNVLES